MPELDALQGQRVVVIGVVSRPELNGCRGLVISTDQSAGRVGVKLAGKGEVVALRPANLRPYIVPEFKAHNVATESQVDQPVVANLPPPPPPCRCLVDRTDATLAPLPALPPHPNGCARSPSPPPLLSVLSPTTFERSWAHESLYRCFAHQSYANKELVVLDTGVAPSPFFSSLDDTRVRYTHIPYDEFSMIPEQAVRSLQTLAQACPSERCSDAPAAAMDVPSLSTGAGSGCSQRDTTNAQAWAPTLAALARATSALRRPSQAGEPHDEALDEALDAALDADVSGSNGVHSTAAGSIAAGSIAANKMYSPRAAAACAVKTGTSQHDAH